MNSQEDILPLFKPLNVYGRVFVENTKFSAGEVDFYIMVVCLPTQHLL